MREEIEWREENVHGHVQTSLPANPLLSAIVNAVHVEPTSLLGDTK